MSMAVRATARPGMTYMGDNDLGPMYISTRQLFRQTIDPAAPLFDPAATDRRLRRACLDGLSDGRRAEKLAEVCGWRVGPWGRDKLAATLAWPPCVDELARFQAQGVRSWDAPVPAYRVVHALAMGVLRGGRDAWSRHDEGLYNWNVEDYYVRFIVRMVWMIGDPDGRGKKLLGRRGKKGVAMVGWIDQADLVEQIYILFHVLLLRHYEEKFAYWFELSCYKRAAFLLSGAAHKAQVSMF